MALSLRDRLLGVGETSCCQQISLFVAPLCCYYTRSLEYYKDCFKSKKIEKVVNRLQNLRETTQVVPIDHMA
ncbi:hypothetical protein I3760_11G032100 [Carya illinoinensis]|nr:hypothetical protein I3760_11G032100 [Carya illinoinensis]